MNWKIKLAIALGFILFVWVYISIADFTPHVEKDEILLKKISELELKIDSLNNQKDSIRTVIDSTHVKIITNEKHYQERINTIIRQSSSDDSSFVANYIRQYSDKNPLPDTK
jgi:hypothetical protein